MSRRSSRVCLSAGLRWWFRASLGLGNRRCCTTRGLERTLFPLRTLTAVGVESEAELAFAGVHQLLYPILGLLELLPAPQRRALEIAFGIAGGPQPDSFLVALAAYQLVCDAAEESPVVLSSTTRIGWIARPREC